jgi:hypothetical protein
MPAVVKRTNIKSLAIDIGYSFWDDKPHLYDNLLIRTSQGMRFISSMVPNQAVFIDLLAGIAASRSDGRAACCMKVKIGGDVFGIPHDLLEASYDFPMDNNALRSLLPDIPHSVASNVTASLPPIDDPRMSFRVDTRGQSALIWSLTH